MRPAVTSDPKPAAKDAGFTLAEVLAGVFVVALLVTGFSELTRRVAHTVAGVRENVEHTRTLRLAQAVFSGLERADPRAIEVTRDRVIGLGGNALMTFQVSGQDGARVLEWTIDDGTGIPAQRRVGIAGARFEMDDGIVRLVDDADSVLLVAYPRRAAANCEFDTVLKTCR